MRALSRIPRSSPLAINILAELQGKPVSRHLAPDDKPPPTRDPARPVVQDARPGMRERAIIAALCFAGFCTFDTLPFDLAKMAKAQADFRQAWTVCGTRTNYKTV